MKKYRTNGPSFTFPTYGKIRIDEIEVIRETNSKVWYMDGDKERREGKRTNYTMYFDTREEAKAYLLEMAEKRKNRAIDELNEANEIIREVNDL